MSFTVSDHSTPISAHNFLGFVLVCRIRAFIGFLLLTCTVHVLESEVATRRVTAIGFVPVLPFGSDARRSCGQIHVHRHDASSFLESAGARESDSASLFVFRPPRGSEIMRARPSRSNHDLGNSLSLAVRRKRASSKVDCSQVCRSVGRAAGPRIKRAR